MLKTQIHSNPNCVTMFRSFLSSWAFPQCCPLGRYSPAYSHYPPPTCTNPLHSSHAGSIFQLEAPRPWILNSFTAAHPLAFVFFGLPPPIDPSSLCAQELMLLPTSCCRIIGGLPSVCGLNTLSSARCSWFGDEEEETPRWWSRRQLPARCPAGDCLLTLIPGRSDRYPRAPSETRLGLSDPLSAGRLITDRVTGTRHLPDRTLVPLSRSPLQLGRSLDSKPNFKVTSHFV